jgi:hypothetical protein
MASKTCRGTTVAGTPCRAAAGPNGLCFFHAHPEKVRSLGQEGGSKNRQKLPEPVSRSPWTAADLQNILADAIQGVRSKNLTPRVASSIAQLCNALHRIGPAAELEARVKKLEEVLSRATKDRSRCQSGDQWIRGG